MDMDALGKLPDLMEQGAIMEHETKKRQILNRLEQIDRALEYKEK